MGNLLFEQNPSPMLIYDVDSLSILKANKAFHAKYKYTPEDIAKNSLTIERIRPKKDIRELYKSLEKERGDQIYEAGIFRHLSKTGEKFYVQVTTQSYPYEGHNARLVALQDLTKRIEAEQNSLKAYDELQHHIANSPLASVKLDHNFQITEWSKRAKEILGYDIEDVRGKTLFDNLFYKEDYHTEVARKIEQLRSGQKHRDIIETKVLTKKGDSVFIRIHVSTRRAKNGKFKSALALIENLTHQKRIETHYKKLFEFARDGVYLLTKDGRFVDCNQEAAHQLKLPVEKLVGKKVSQFAPKYQDDGTLSEVKARKMTLKALKDGFSLFDWNIKQADGECIDVEISLNSIHLPDSEYIHAIARDVTGKKEMQSKLKKSEEMFRNLFLKSPAALVMVDPDDNVQAVNRSFEKLFGYRSEEIQGKNIDRMIVPPELLKEAPNVTKGSYAEQEFQIETVRVTKNGDRKYVIAAGMPVFINNEAMAGFGMYIDITDRKIYEDELNDSIEEKQVMLEEIHHRVKNNLAVISGILQLQAFDATDENARKALDASQLRIKSMALVHEMLYKTESFSKLSFEAYLHQLLAHLDASLPLKSKNIEVNIDAEKIDMTMKEAVPAALLVNELVTNAYKHAFNDAENGVIDIELIRGEKAICLRVFDNGKGLDKDFDLENSGTLGLNLIKTLSEQLGAELNYGNKNGAFFEFCIPDE